MKVFFVSDVHINSKQTERYKKFISFLNFLIKEQATHLFIVGDLFDFLYGNGKPVLKKYSELFEKLLALNSGGTQIFYLFGNHDFNFKLPLKYLKNTFDDLKINIDGLNIYIRHGDGLDPLDYKYRILKKIVRSSFFRILTLILPSFVIYKMADTASAFSRKVSNNFVSKKKRYLVYRDYAGTLLKNTEIDICVLAHTHVAELVNIKDVNDKNKYYANTGFFANEGTYVKLFDGNIELLKF